MLNICLLPWKAILIIIILIMIIITIIIMIIKTSKALIQSKTVLSAAQ